MWLCLSPLKISGLVSAAAAVEDISVPSLGPDVWNKTYYPKGRDTKNNKKQWYIIDAEGQTLGRLATLAATHIRGKTSPTFSPSMDMGEVSGAEGLGCNISQACLRSQRHCSDKPENCDQHCIAMPLCVDHAH